MKCPYCGKENEGTQCVKCHAEIKPEPIPEKKPEHKSKDKERS